MISELFVAAANAPLGWSLDTWSRVVTWGLSLLWLALIIRCWYLARYHALRLEEHEDVLNHSYLGHQHPQSRKPFLDPLQHLQAEGWRASAPLSRHDMIAHWRASAQADKQRMSSYIEMMPQYGLLGTVLSLFLSAFLFEFNMAMLGLALVTTIFGLAGALMARAQLEMPSEKHYYNILEFLQNEKVVEALIAFVEERSAASPDAGSSPVEEDDQGEHGEAPAPKNPMSANPPEPSPGSGAK